MPAGSLAAPHGGMLMNRIADPDQADKLTKRAPELPAITLSAKQACDLEMIAIGAFSPLNGFVKRADFESICNHMRLSDQSLPQAGGAGPVWPIPITLAVDDKTQSKLDKRGQAALYHADGTLLAVMYTSDIYPHNKKLEIASVFGTEDPAHPGVKAVLDEGDWLVGGAVQVITVTPQRQPGEQFPEYRLTPAQTRAEFERRGWKTVVAFQTRNPIHRAHEYLTKCAQEICDGLLIHPLVGETKPGDIPADVRMDCYKALIDKYYVPERTMLSVMPAAMRYAGPREAILHALVRKNYGCSHFIVGRDHAGVGNYYGTYDAQQIFDRFRFSDIGVHILKFEHTAWCNACEGMTSPKTCPHGPDQKVALSGTKVRDMLAAGERPPQEFSRPEVADVLIEWAASQVPAAAR
ncbi:MAG: sulfate adenylyltransferase [Phycisphaerales bacterium]|nr:sulfate adenylyltransferase [Phycisphaerales bacterium]MCI0629838.1 sulfate adenylyltransferase [Phycisphaerales bacterium]